MLKLYDTLSKSLKDIPNKDRLNLYTCGPTVYNYAHIGNLRSYILADLLYRTLKFDGYHPKWVMNITDIDDKTIKGTIAKYGSGATVENLREYTKFYLDAFLQDLGEVNVSKDEITFIRVTDVIPQIQEFIVELINKGYAYKAEDGSTYFSIDKYQKDFGDYGELVGHKFLEGKKVGARVAVDEYEKDNLSDFALWKAHDSATDAGIFWDHPVLGKGRPGWHIECSVINKIGFNGEPTDIHTGGVDLIFPHHTNEIAQSQPFYKPFSKAWCHCEHLLVDGQRMGKRFNNFYTVKDLRGKGFSGLDLRYLYLNAHYRVQQNFTWENLLAAKTARERLNAVSESVPDGAAKALDDDLNFPRALASAAENQDVLDKVFGVLGNGLEQDVPDSITILLGQRQQAKTGKDFSKSDELRKQIEELGYEVMDTAEGQKVKKKLQI
ncbi:MAG: class I tRNA ligase family protein [Patescibacteria group bacterium]|nr:class I tRNA ligase family protein [Patescibacteria group bacterium]